MTDGHVTDQDQLGKVPEETPVVPAAPAADPWATAFDALEEKVAPADAGDQAGAEAGTDGAPATAAGTSGTPPAGDAGTAPSDALVGSGDARGPVPPAIGDGDEVDSAPVDVEAAVAGYAENIEKRTLAEVTKMFVERTDDQGNKLIRQSNGQLGATINDPDIYRVDPDTGTVAFFNPDTGKPFTGDNPRAQAKQWVDGYNEELRDAFNRVSEQRQSELEAEMAPVIELLKFTPTFEALDPTRQKMLEALIEEYEVYDSKGVHVGYSCDLDKALAQVNRQVASIQAARQTPATPPTPPTGPALDMPNSGSPVGANREVKSVADAMELLQDQQLADARKK